MVEKMGTEMGDAEMGDVSTFRGGRKRGTKKVETSPFFYFFLECMGGNMKIGSRPIIWSIGYAIINLKSLSFYSFWLQINKSIDG